MTQIVLPSVLLIRHKNERGGDNHCLFFLMSKVVVTRVLPPQTQERLLSQGFNIVQWQQDSAMPREELLKAVQGKIFFFNSHIHKN